MLASIHNIVTTKLGGPEDRASLGILCIYTSKGCNVFGSRMSARESLARVYRLR